MTAQEEMRVALDHPPKLRAETTSVIVQPVDVAKRIMAVREQLAAEWREDLDNLEVKPCSVSRSPCMPDQDLVVV